jgi:hypothetical protein
MLWTKILLRTTLVFTLAGGFIPFGSIANARPYDRDDCNRNVQNWEFRMNRDVNRHGYNSRQANYDRRELERARRSCQRQFGNDWRYRDNDRH